jgi:2-methylisocitrate lyase-like PEP mutase family enzyme
MQTLAEKGQTFRDLHARPGILLLPNPWDAGTAKLLQSLGFEALATTSLGMANALGRPDGEGSVSHCRPTTKAKSYYLLSRKAG